MAAHDDKPSLGIDIGGTKITVARVDMAGCVLESRTVPTPRRGLEEALACITELAAAMLEGGSKDCQGIGVAAPGPVDSPNGRLLWAPSLGWRQVAFRDIFQQRFNLPVKVANDVDANAWGELHYGWGKDSCSKPNTTLQNFFWMTISTGIGGSLIINRKPYVGKGIAGEIGHLILDEEGPAGLCGHAGCLESLASGTGITAYAKKVYKVGVPGDDLTPAFLAQQARAGEPTALMIWQRAGEYIGKALSYVINLLDPDRIVLGGGVALGAGDLLLQPVMETARRLALPREPFPPITLTMLGSDAGVIGAAALILKKIPRHSG